MFSTPTMPRPPGARPFFPLTFLVLVAVLTPACGDSEGDPLGVVLTDEARSALSLDLDLPSLPGIVAGSGDTDDSDDSAGPDRWTGRWEASWLMEPARGREVREAVYDEAVEPVARTLGPDGVRNVLTSTEEVAEAAASRDLAELPPLYRARVEEARELVTRGRRAMEDGASAVALRAALEAADRMRTVSPQSVAHHLLARARRGAAELPDRPRQERERIGRLISGAESALDQGDYRRAIHRAYYACQLLDVGLP